MHRLFVNLVLACALLPPLLGDLQKRDPLVHPSVDPLGLRESGRIHAWICFSDKGVKREKVSLALSRARGQLTERALWRRGKAVRVNLVTSRDIPVFEPYISQVIASGAILRNRSRWLNAVSVSATRNQLTQISSLSFVSKVDPVLVYRRPVEMVEQKGSFLEKRGRTGWDGLDYGSSEDQIVQINGHLAHEAGYGGQGIIVLMLDTGYFLEHESIQADSVLAQWDFINQDSVTQNETAHEDKVLQHEHGTYTLSILGGYAPGKLIGPAYRARFLLAKTEIVDQEIMQEEDNFVAALEWGEALGADVVSSSLGYPDWYSYCDMDGNTAVTTRAMDVAASLGIVCVTAVGNDGRRDPPVEPCSTLTYYIHPPSDADSVIAVGAVNRLGSIADFSSRGPTFDGRIKPEVCALGVETVSASPFGTDSYVAKDGTSLSTPLVGGGAAVLLSAHPDWSPMDVRKALIMTASFADSANNDYGYGIIDLWAAISFDPFSVEPSGPLPSRFSLHQNYPNPFNMSTTIHYDVPRSVPATLNIFNLLGEQVDILIDGEVSAGRHAILWDGSRFPTGIYLIHMKAGEYSETRKMILLK